MSALAGRISDQETVTAIVDGLDGGRLRRFLETNPVEGLVLAGRDEEHLHLLAGESLHRARADRFAFRVVNLVDLCARVHPSLEAIEKAGLLLASARAMVRQYRWLRPANVRPRFGCQGGRLSRRALLALPVLRYEVIPAVAQSRCAAARGCQLCVAACPAEAIGTNSGTATIEKARCRDCGACLAACPAEAIDHPFYRRRVMDAGLGALLSEVTPMGSDKIAAFVCPGGMEVLREAGRHRLRYAATILPLEVPCAEFVDWYLILRAFDLGAAAVMLLACGEACHHGCSLEMVKARFTAMGRLLDAWALGSKRLIMVREESAQWLASRLNAYTASVAGLPRQPLARGLPTAVGVHRYQLARLVVALWERLGFAGELSLTDDYLPFGQAKLHVEACTLCALCAERCPTGALAYTESQEEARLLFTARDCTGCGLCAAACPEAALRVERRLEPASLKGGALALKIDELMRCHQCQRPFAPRAMTSRVLSQLGAKASPIMTGYCPDCRLTATPQCAEA